MAWVEWAYAQELTYNQAVEGVLVFAHEHFWISLKPTWRLLRAWRDREPVEVRHPVSMPLLKALMTVCLSWGWDNIAFLWWLSFHCLLRPGEMLALTAYEFVFHQRLVWGTLWETVCVIRILRPKTRRLGPRRQHVLVTEPLLVTWLSHIVFLRKQVEDKSTLSGLAIFESCSHSQPKI